MKRRTLLTALGVGSIGSIGRTSAAQISEDAVLPKTAIETPRGVVEPLSFDSTCSLLDANLNAVTGDPDWVAVNSEATAGNEDANGDGSALFTPYPEDTKIPLVGSESGVVGVGAVFLQDGTGFQSAGNEEFVLNVLDQEAGEGTILWDEGHGQFFGTGKHRSFVGYAENNGYTVEATSSLATDLGGADVTAVVVTTPPEAFTQNELEALATFVDDGGTVLLFGQSDFGGYNAPRNLNEVCAALDAPFRFNDDQVVDYVNNAGIFFVPSTDEFDRGFPYFADRPGIEPPEFERGRIYTAEVVSVDDGDTVNVQFPNGYIDEVRLLGIDTPETFLPAELVAEWEGIDDPDWLAHRGQVASAFARDRLAGETVELRFDSEEPFRGGFGRLLMYLEYDADGDGLVDTDYNRQVVAEGYGRVYDSGFARHDEFIAVEERAKRHGRGVWARSDIDAAPPLSGRPATVDEIFVPKAVPLSVPDGTSAGGKGKGKGKGNAKGNGQGHGPNTGVDVVARASETATRPGAPLAVVDDGASVAVVGGQVIDEDYDEADSAITDPASYQNFQFAAGLVERLTPRAGGYLIDGGHGQFDAEEAVCAEDAAYFGRYLEGLDLTLTQYNDIDTAPLTDGKVLFVSSPAEPFTREELTAVNRYRRGGGSVVVLADRTGDRRLTNELLAALGTDIRVAAGVVDDPEANAGEPFLPVSLNVSVIAPDYDENRGTDAYARATEPGQTDRTDGHPVRPELREGRVPLPAAAEARHAGDDE